MVWVRSPVYFYKRNDTFYFSRAVPSDLGPAFKSEKSRFPSEQNLKQKLLNLQQLYLTGLSGIGIVLEWR